MASGDESSIMVAVSLSDNEEESKKDESIPNDTENVSKDDNPEDNAPSDNNVENTDQLFEKIKSLEEESGRFAADILTKDNFISNFEKETSSLKSEIAHMETNHANIIAEHERKFIMLSEEMGAKVAEVANHFEKFYQQIV